MSESMSDITDELKCDFERAADELTYSVLRAFYKKHSSRQEQLNEYKKILRKALNLSDGISTKHLIATLLEYVRFVFYEDSEEYKNKMKDIESFCRELRKEADKIK
ncbi:MAG: hypothetical protein IJ730_02210 [Alphaproteobacteria bacterium]|nr:hypothetical protein [Alphaproteobacteria bacterium]